VPKAAPLQVNATVPVGAGAPCAGITSAVRLSVFPAATCVLLDDSDTVVEEPVASFGVAPAPLSPSLTAADPLFSPATFWFVPAWLDAGPLLSPPAWGVALELALAGFAKSWLVAIREEAI
jgi:hypothetical protein